MAPLSIGGNEDRPQRLRKQSHVQEIGEERKDRIRKKLDDYTSSTRTSTTAQSVAPLEVPVHHPVQKPHVSPRAADPSGPGATPTLTQATVIPSLAAHPVQSKGLVAGVVGSTANTNIWGNFLKFAPRGLVSLPQSEANTSSSVKQPPATLQIPVQNSTGNGGVVSDNDNKPRFNEFVPGGAKHHAVSCTGSQQHTGLASSKFASVQSPLLTSATIAQPVGGPAFQNMASNRAFILVGNHLVDPFSNITSPSRTHLPRLCHNNIFH